MNEFKQAIIVGASTMGQEQKKLVGLLKWAGLVPPTEEEKKIMELSDCGGSCKTCAHSCGRKEIVKDIYLAAADGGLAFLMKQNIKPDYFVGDMDSIMEFGFDKEQVEQYLSDMEADIYPIEKDDTDTALAVKKAYEMGYKEMMLYGCSGGMRVSHTFANIQLMDKYESLGCHIKMMGDGFQAEILKNSKMDYSKALKGNISVICLSDRAENVVIQGLKYEYQGELTNQFALGVSNSFVGMDAFIQVEKGTLLLIYESA